MNPIATSGRLGRDALIDDNDGFEIDAGTIITYIVGDLHMMFEVDEDFTIDKKPDFIAAKGSVVLIAGRCTEKYKRIFFVGNCRFPTIDELGMYNRAKTI